MKIKHFVFAAFAFVLASCSDDEESLDNLKGTSANVDVYDEYWYKIGFGSSFDVTKEIGLFEKPILDIDKLKNERAIELDTESKLVRLVRTGKNYSQMTENINQCLMGDVELSSGNLQLSDNLYSMSDGKNQLLDIYEYGVSMIVNKKFALRIKPEKLSSLRDFVSDEAWADINATDRPDRLDVNGIIELYKSYGTHIATKAFYGSLYRHFLLREQYEWESPMKAMMKLGMNEKGEVKAKMDVDDNAGISVTSTDENCFKQGLFEETEGKIGGNVSVANLDEWLNTCSADKPTSCAFLGFSLGTDDNPHDSGLIPLYELLDDGDERKTAMKEALTMYLESESIRLSTCKLVITDAFGRHFSDGKAPAYLYEEWNGKVRKYFRLDEEISKHVKGFTKGKFHFYYSLGHLLDEAVVDMKFAESDDLSDEWKKRGNHANEGVSGALRNRYLCIKIKNVKDDVSEDDFVTGFGVKVDGTVKSISKYTSTDFKWTQNGDGWYKGLVHDDVYCIYTRDKLNK